jgi:hypothetical protein
MPKILPVLAIFALTLTTKAHANFTVEIYEQGHDQPIELVLQECEGAQPYDVLEVLVSEDLPSCERSHRLVDLQKALIACQQNTMDELRQATLEVRNDAQALHVHGSKSRVVKKRQDLKASRGHFGKTMTVLALVQMGNSNKCQ